MIRPKDINGLFIHWQDGKQVIPKDKTLDDYFRYIVDSEINGQNGQVKELINKLSWSQFKMFLLWLDQEEQNGYVKAQQKVKFIKARDD